MKILAILLSLAATLCAQADVIIYKIVQTNIWIGGGTRFEQVVYGRMVFDPEALEIGVFTWLPNFRFQMDCPQATVGHAIGPNGWNHSAWFLDGTARDGSNQLVGVMHYYLRGRDTTGFILVSPSVRAPIVARGIYRASYRAADGSVAIGEGNLRVSYLEDSTKAANLDNLLVSEVLDQLRQTWIRKGWVEVTPDAPCPF